MNWGDCKLIALQTMFANEGAAIAVDDSNQDYIHAMPGKANEAMLQVTSDGVGRPLLKRITITVAEAAEETATEAGLTLPAVEGWYTVHMTEYFPKWKKVNSNQVYQLQEDGSWELAEVWHTQGEEYLLLPGTAAQYIVWYQAYPELVTAATEDSQELGLPPECAALVPLYIAAELYKEDELAMATMFRNEYEDGLAKLREDWASRSGTCSSGKIRNTTGWW